MQRFILEQSGDFYSSHSGLALVGLCMNKYTSMGKQLGQQVGVMATGSSHPDVLRSYIGLLSIGKSDYDAIRNHRDDTYFKKSLGIKRIPLAEIMRQRFDKYAEAFRQVVEQCNVELLKKSKAPISTLTTGHVPLDIDVFPMDNSDSKKDGVSWTYHNYHGYAPIAAYLGLEGWCLEIELRPGSQHSQNDFVPFLERSLANARQVAGKNKKLLVRLDSAHDAVETKATMRQHQKVSYILKWNPRAEDRASLADKAFAKGRVTEVREGKHVALLTTWQEQEHEAQLYRFTKVVRVTKRTIDSKGQHLLVPDILLGEAAPIRHPAKRRRIKTVIQELIYLAAA